MFDETLSRLATAASALGKSRPVRENKAHRDVVGICPVQEGALGLDALARRRRLHVSRSDDPGARSPDKTAQSARGADLLTAISDSPPMFISELDAAGALGIHHRWVAGLWKRKQPPLSPSPGLSQGLDPRS